MDDSDDDNDGWETCGSEEEEDPSYDYEIKLEQRKKKKRTPAKVKVEIENDVYNSRDPIYFKEDTVYYFDQSTGPTDQDFECSVLTDLDNVFPLGYPSE